jgi:hypothetical protein
MKIAPQLQLDAQELDAHTGILEGIPWWADALADVEEGCGMRGVWIGVALTLPSWIAVIFALVS